MKIIDVLLMTVVALSLLGSCTNESGQAFSYEPLDPNMTIDSLPENTSLRIIGFSGGKESNTNDLCYYQFMCVTATSDTVRVLAPAITVPSDTDLTVVYTAPTGFDPAKGVTTATFRSLDSAATRMLSIMNLPKTGMVSAEAVGKLIDGPAQKEILVVNKSLRGFDQPGYLTVKGVLHFNEIPW